MANALTTAEQLLAMPDEPGFVFELVRGELRRMTGPGWWHGAVAAQVGYVLFRFVAEHRLGMVFCAETGFWIEKDPDTVRCPDAAFVRTERVPPAPAPGWFQGAPDLAVEITSPNDTFAEVHEKALFWIASGVRLLWVVEPMARRVTVYRPGGSLQVVSGDDALDGGDVLPGFTFPVRNLFPS